MTIYYSFVKFQLCVDFPEKDNILLVVISYLKPCLTTSSTSCTAVIEIITIRGFIKKC